MNPRRRTRNRGLLIALWANAGVFGLVALALLSRADLPSLLPSAHAQNQPPIAGGAGVFVMPAQLSTNVWGCYLLDVDSQTLAAYTYKPGQNQLQFVAARTYKYDRRMQNYNTSPVPNEMRELLDREVRAQGMSQGTAAPSPPAAPAGASVVPSPSSPGAAPLEPPGEGFPK